MSETTVIYHADCADGFGAAWAAWRALGDTARYVPAHYTDAPPEPARGDRWYLLDCSYSAAILHDLARAGVTVTVLDHHASARTSLAEASMAGWAHVVFDPARSGAVLAWEHFHPAGSSPRLLAYVQDRDLWRWALLGSRSVSAWLRSYPFNFETWDQLALLLAEGPTFDDAVMEGGAILRAQAQQIASQVARAGWVEVGGYRVPGGNATLLISEIGEALCQAHPWAPFSATFFIRPDGARVWSLRSRGAFDVGALAKTLGGGGHPGAAGFMTASEIVQAEEEEMGGTA